MLSIPLAPMLARSLLLAILLLAPRFTVALLVPVATAAPVFDARIKSQWGVRVWGRGGDGR